MSQLGLPILYTLVLWWFSTGLILYLDGLPRRTYHWSMAAATVLCAASLVVLYLGRDDATASGAYVAFTCGLLAWGWQEMAFLMGFVSGPRRIACPPACPEGRRLQFAIAAILHHELALLATAAAVIAVTWGGANQVGAWTFLTLWVMRLSAKLNLFLGVRNLAEEFLPDGLRYLASYFRKRPMNLLFPVSVTAATVVATLIWREALAPHATAFDSHALAFLGTLLALAVIEHWFMVVPFPTTALWRWSLRSREVADGLPKPLPKGSGPG